MPDRLPLRVTIRRPAAHVNVLPVARVASHRTRLLVSADMTPVWPVASEAEQALLHAAAAVFGARTAQLTALPSARPVKSLAGQVVGLGDVEADVELYAHLTNRTWCLAHSVDELAARTYPEVILTVSLRLDPDLVEFLYYASSGGAKAGILWGRNKAELAQLVLMRSAASMLSGASINRSVVVDCTSYHAERNRDVSKMIRASLEADAGVLTVAAHGDGYSTRLSKQMAMCAMDSLPAFADRARAPRCVVTGICDKFEKPVREAVREGNIRPPEGMVARVLVLASCLTAFVGSSTLDSAWTHLARLVLNPRVGAVLASPNVMIFSGASISQDLSQDLAEGVPVGRALADYEDSPTVNEFGSRFLLFGDPRTRAAPGGTGAVNAHRLASHQAHPRLQGGGVAVRDHEISMLRLLATHIRPDMRDVASETSRCALAALNVYEGAPESRPKRVGDWMRFVLLGHLATGKVQTPEAWLNAAYFKCERKTRKCPLCGLRLCVYSVRFGSGYERKVLQCMRCYLVADRPASSRLELRVQLPQIEIRDPPISGDWVAAAFVIPSRARDTTVHFWPRDASGAPAARVTLSPSGWPTGPLWVRFAIIAGTSVHVAGALAKTPVAD
jgi:hypothetical protein